MFYNKINVLIVVFTMILIMYIASCRNNDRGVTSYSISFNCDIELEKTTRERYKDIAKSIYYNYIIENNIDFSMSDVDFDSMEINKILKMIQLIDKSKSPESDTVLNIIKIDNKAISYYDRINIYGNKNNGYLDNLVNGIIPTGEDVLDVVLEKYDLKLKSSMHYNRSGVLTLYTKQEYNMYAIGIELLKSPIINRFDEKVGWIGLNSSIDLVKNEKFEVLRFYYGSGDCIAGCMSKRYWEFKIEHCKAEFIRSYGGNILPPY